MSESKQSSAHSLTSWASAHMTGFYVYAITFDQDTFGIFATQADAEESLARQIAEGGPAWGGCKIERWFVAGEPERGEQNPASQPQEDA